MHFAFAITEYFPYGGAQRDFFAVATAMAKRGHQISVITLKWHGDVPANWTLFELGKEPVRSNHGRIKALSEYVISLKQSQAFDNIIGFTKLAGLDIYFAADPCFTANRYRGINRWLPRYRTYAAIERELFANPDLKVFFLTPFQQQQYQQIFPVKTANQRVLPICVDERFHFSAARFEQARDWRSQQMIDPSRRLLLFVAADFNTKGLDRVIAALAALPVESQQQLELWIVGNGKQALYANRLKALKVSHRFWGGLQELADFYFAADYLVHPARKEAAGMVLAEAAAARLPMLISDICGYAGIIVQDKLSALLPRQQIAAKLATALQQCVIDKQPKRSEPNNLVKADSRADICADQIEQWCQA